MLKEKKIKPAILHAMKKAGWEEGRRISLTQIKEGCDKLEIEFFEAAEQFIHEFGGLRIIFKTRSIRSDASKYYEKKHLFYDFSDEAINKENKIEYIGSDIIFDQNFDNSGCKYFLEILADYEIKEPALVVGRVLDGWAHVLIGKSGKFYFATEEGTCFTYDTVEEMFNALEDRDFVEILMD